MLVTDKMVSISLAKALKVKARLAGRVASLTTEIQTYNSVEASQAENYDISKKWEQRKLTVAALLQLKTEINAANFPVTPKIYLLAEKKSEMALFKALDTTDGEKHAPYSEHVIKYHASFTKKQVEEIVHLLEKEIDALQDDLDRHNHVVSISVPESILSL